MSLYVILDEEFNISSHVGIPVNGVIGYHLFKNHPIFIDYVSKKITVYENSDVVKKKIRKFEEFRSRLNRVNLTFLLMWK
jgi:hypothetical protein